MKLRAKDFATGLRALIDSSFSIAQALGIDLPEDGCNCKNCRSLDNQVLPNEQELIGRLANNVYGTNSLGDPDITIMDGVLDYTTTGGLNFTWCRIGSQYLHNEWFDEYYIFTVSHPKGVFYSTSTLGKSLLEHGFEYDNDSESAKHI